MELQEQIDCPQKLYGYHFNRLDVIGNFWDRSDAVKLYEETKRRFPHLID